MRLDYRIFDSLALSIALIAIASIISGLGFIFRYALLNYSFVGIIIEGFCLILGFILIPLIIVRLLEIKVQYPKLSKESAIVLFLIILVASSLMLQINEAIHSFFIAMSEEIFFRVIIFSVLLRYFSRNQTIVIGSLLFGFLLHLNGDFFVNAVIKFPASVLLYYLAHFYGIQYSIGVHWFYNVLVSTLFI